MIDLVPTKATPVLEFVTKTNKIDFCTSTDKNSSCVVGNLPLFTAVTVFTVFYL